MLYKDIYSIVLSYVNVDSTFHTAIDCVRIFSKSTFESANTQNKHALHYLLIHKLDECRLKHPLRKELKNTCYSCLIEDLHENKICIEEDFSNTYLNKCYSVNKELNNCTHDRYTLFTPFDHVSCSKHQPSGCVICDIHTNILDNRRHESFYHLYIALRYMYEIWFSTIEHIFQQL